MLRTTLSQYLQLPSNSSTMDSATGAGWSITHECFIFTANLQSSVSGDGFHRTNGFLIRLQLFQLLNPLYLNYNSPLLTDSSDQFRHFTPFHFSSSSTAVRRFVLSTLSDLGLPSSDPEPLIHLLSAFFDRHHDSSLSSVVPLFLTFTATTLLRDPSEAADWLHGGTPESHVIRTLRSTLAFLQTLRHDSLALTSSRDSCMVCMDRLTSSEDDEQNDEITLVCSLPCSHTFHYGCVSEWLSFDHRCPICRFPLPWIHAILPDLLPAAAAAAAAADDLDIEIHHLHRRPGPGHDDIAYNNVAELPAGFFAKIGCFFKKLVRHMFLALK